MAVCLRRETGRPLVTVVSEENSLRNTPVGERRRDDLDWRVESSLRQFRLREI